MDTSEFGKYLKTVRIRCEMTQAEVAEKVGCSKSTVSNLETGRCIPSAIVLYKYSNYFSLSFDFLLGLIKELPDVDQKYIDAERAQQKYNPFLDSIIHDFRESNREAIENGYLRKIRT